jgi:hypothetical protein
MKTLNKKEMKLNKIKKYIRRKLPESFNRLIDSKIVEVGDSHLKGISNPFHVIYKQSLWDSQESKSGRGSEVETTITIRERLPLLIDKYAIQSMLDIPCGDYNWMKLVEKKCTYLGGDIVEELIENNQRQYSSLNVQFKRIDMTVDSLPKVDLIFCKDCLQHLSYENIKKAINNFRQSGSTYLLVTSYSKTWRNHDIYDGDYRPLNLLKKPFCFPKPIERIQEESELKVIEPDKNMYLYRLESIPSF